MFSKTKMILPLVMMLIFVTGNSGHVPQCACASTDTEVFNGNRENMFHLQAPNCLPLVEDDGDEFSPGLINVMFENKYAFVKSDDVFVRNCNGSFGCMCTTNGSTIYSYNDRSSHSLTTLTSDTCSTIKGKIHICDGDTWVPVENNNQTGWIEKGDARFYPSCHTTSGCPSIISRVEWGAREVLSVTKMNEAPHYAIIHHTAGGRCFSRERCVEKMRWIQGYHMTKFGWDNIGYNFVIGEDGLVYEGRGWDVQGAHTKSCNQRSLGIAVFGNFQTVLPNGAALNALRGLLDCAVRMGHLDPDYKLFGRRDWGSLSRVSPGEKLASLISTWKHYNQTELCASNKGGR